MKRILFMLVSLVCLFTLASCENSNNKEKIYTYTNANGEEVEVEIKQTEDEGEVKEIVNYLNSVSSTAEIKGLEVDLNASVEAIGFEENQNISGNASANIKVNQEQGLSASGSFNLKASLSATDKYDYSGEGNLYYAYANPNYVYLDYELNGLGSEIPAAGKYKISMMDLILILSQIMNNGTISLSTSTDTPNIDDAFTALDTYLPNTKIYVSLVTDDSLTMNVDIALKDLATLAGNTYSGDAVISVDFSFALETGLILSLNTNIDMLEVLVALSNISDLNTSVKSFIVDAEIEFNYSDNINIDTILASEESNYLEIDLGNVPEVKPSI